MQFQTFRGADVREALSRVKRSFGPDALIGSTTHVSNGRRGALGNSYVEVTAAPAAPRRTPFAHADEPEDEAPTVAPRRRPVQKLEAAIAEGAAPRSPAPKATPQRAMADIERELVALRAIIEDLEATRPPREKAIRVLHELGIEGALAKELATGAPKSSRTSRRTLEHWLLQRLGERLEVNPGIIARSGPQLIACVGPTGVGKTTTLAKLAARARLDLGRSVSVITLDTFRVGAVEQWQRYASIMGLPFAVANDPSQFAHLVSQSRAEIVLVDTAGRSAMDTSEDWPLATCMRSVSGRAVHSLLVLPAWLRGRDAERTVELYQKLPTTGIVVSKLDETAQRGGVLHASLPTGLPLTYLCDGPRVPEDVDDATLESVLQAMFPSES